MTPTLRGPDEHAIRIDFGARTGTTTEQRLHQLIGHTGRPCGESERRGLSSPRIARRGPGVCHRRSLRQRALTVGPWAIDRRSLGLWPSSEERTAVSEHPRRSLCCLEREPRVERRRELVEQLRDRPAVSRTASGARGSGSAPCEPAICAATMAWSASDSVPPAAVRRPARSSRTAGAAWQTIHSALAAAVDAARNAATSSRRLNVASTMAPPSQSAVRAAARPSASYTSWLTSVA